jgi:tetratricopeptide (TPR) repeat protein
MVCAAVAFVPGAGLSRAQQAGQQQGMVQQALAFEQQGKYFEAIAAWEGVVKAQPRNAQAYAHLGLLEARQERYTEAIAHYEKAQALNPGIPQLSLNLGLALFKSGRFRESAKIFEAELKKHPKSMEAERLTILAGMSHYGAHDYGAAIPYLKEAADADVKNLALRLDLAHCYLWTKQLDATMAVYKEILLIDPDSAAADMIAGEALDEKGDNAGAVQQFQAAVKANPKEPNVHFGLGYLLWAQKRYDEAIPEFEAELANDPKNYQAMIYLGDTYVKQNQFDKARPVLEEAVKYQGSAPLVHLDLGIVYMETGGQDVAAQNAAILELNRTVAMEPDNVAAHFRLANVYRSMGRKEEAKAEFAKTSSLNKKTDEGVYKRIQEANARPEPESGDAGAKPKPEK